MQIMNNGQTTQVKQILARTKGTSAIERAIDQCEQGYVRQLHGTSRLGVLTRRNSCNRD
jgi:hypothetical protein